jgi:hypothetical protein
MALMGEPGKVNTGAPAAQAQTANVDGDKAKREEAYRNYKAKRAEKQKAAYENALKLRDELSKAGMLDKLSASAKEFVLSLCKDPSERAKSGGFGGPSIFSVLFGDNPKVGQKITLEEAFNKTYKGKSTLDLWVKRWADKDIIVECTIDPVKMINTTYTIKSLPTA